MKTINIIGSGNVVHHLVRALAELSNYKIQNVAVRSLDKVADFFPKDLIVTTFEDLKPADITLISVTDSAIAEVSDKIPYTDSLVVHTSGNNSIRSFE